MHIKYIITTMIILRLVNAYLKQMNIIVKFKKNCSLGFAQKIVHYRIEFHMERSFNLQGHLYHLIYLYWCLVWTLQDTEVILIFTIQYNQPNMILFDCLISA